MRTGPATLHTAAKVMPMHTLNRQSAADIADYITAQQAGGKPPSTLYLRSWQLRRFAEEHPGSIRAATTADLARHLTSHGWAPATMYSVRATMIGFYRHLVKAGRIRRNPAADLDPVKRPRRRQAPAPEDVVQRPASDPRAQLMIDLGARQGLRRCEIVAVHSRDIIRDLNGWALVVHGKGSKERVVPLHPDVAARILAAGPGWLFPSPRGGHLSPSRAWAIITTELDGWGPHSLRRRFATKINQETHDLVSIQIMLGHANLSTTQLYAGSSVENLRDALGHAA